MITTFSAIISTMQHTGSIMWMIIPLISLWSRSADLDSTAVKQQLLTTRARHRHTHHPSRQEEKFREAARNSGKRRPLPNKTQLRVPKQYTTSNPQWPNAAYQCPLFWLLKLAGELLLNIATDRLNQVGFLSIRAYDSDSLQALSLILLLVRFCENELKTF
jgi:hypothetical protein